MTVSLKCQYALRAVFELALRDSNSPARIADIAAAQGIPLHFLENILNELKRTGIVRSFRGKHGGYALARSPGSVSVGEIVRSIEGPMLTAGCVNGTSDTCPAQGQCVFLPMWVELEQAISDVYDSTTFGDLVSRHQQQAAVLDYVI